MGQGPVVTGGARWRLPFFQEPLAPMSLKAWSMLQFLPKWFAEAEMGHPLAHWRPTGRWVVKSWRSLTGARAPVTSVSWNSGRLCPHMAVRWIIVALWYAGTVSENRRVSAGGSRRARAALRLATLVMGSWPSVSPRNPKDCTMYFHLVELGA
jgi:hypothetical protein